MLTSSPRCAQVSNLSNSWHNSVKVNREKEEGTVYEERDGVLDIGARVPVHQSFKH